MLQINGSTAVIAGGSGGMGASHWQKSGLNMAEMQQRADAVARRQSRLRQQMTGSHAECF